MDREFIGDLDGLSAGPGAVVMVPLIALVNLVLSGLWALVTLPTKVFRRSRRRPRS